MDYQLLSQELITHLRSEHSQRDLSQRLGFSYNQIGKWETGATKIKWVDFVQICISLDVPLLEKNQFYFEKQLNKESLVNLADCLLDSYSLVDLNNKLLVTRLKKWKTGRLHMDLAGFLEILDSYPSSLFAWLSLLTDCSKLDSIRKAYDYFKNCLEAVAKDPLLIFINASLKVEEYKQLSQHDENLLAKHALTNLSGLRSGLNKLLKLNIVRYDGNKYFPCPFDFSFSNLRSKDLRKFNKYTTLIAGFGYPLHPAPIKNYEKQNMSNSSIRVNAISKEASEKIHSLLKKFHNEVSDVIKKDDKPKNNVQVIVNQNFATSFVETEDVESVIQLCENSKLPAQK